MSHQQKIYTSITLLAVIGLFLVVFFILPIFGGIAEQSQQLRAQKKKLATINLMAKSFIDFEKSYNYYQKVLEDMAEILTGQSAIDPEIPVEFISFFKEQAEELKLSLKITPLPSGERDAEGQTDDFWNVLQFRIEGLGEYKSFSQFLQKLEYGHWFVKVSDLSIRKEERPRLKEGEAYLEGGQLVQFNLLIKVYAQAEAE